MCCSCLLLEPDHVQDRLRIAVLPRDEGEERRRELVLLHRHLLRQTLQLEREAVVFLLQGEKKGIDYASIFTSVETNRAFTDSAE